MWRTVFLIAIGIIMLWVVPVRAAQVPQEVVQAQLDALDTHEIDHLLSQINRDVSGYVPPLELRSFIQSLASGGVVIDLPALFKGLIRALFREVIANSHLLGSLILLAVLMAVLQNLQAGFEGETVGKLAYAVGYLVLIVLILSSFRLTIKTAQGIIVQLMSFMLALLPALIALLFGSGAPTSAGLFHPLMISTIHVVSVVMSQLVFPFLFLAAVLDIVSNLSDSYKVSGLSSLLKQLSILVLGVSLAGFLGVMIVYKASGEVADGIALRSAKFLASVFIPVVGKMFADASELVFSSSMFLKSALGALGALAIVLMVAFPLVKIIALIFVYRITASIIQPLGGGKIVELLQSIGNSLVMVSVVVGTVGLMFFLAMTVIIGAIRPF